MQPPAYPAGMGPAGPGGTFLEAWDRWRYLWHDEACTCESCERVQPG